MTASTAKQAKGSKPKKRIRRKSEPYLVQVESRIRFRTENPVSVDAVIASLRGLDRIVKIQLPKAIEAVTGAKVSEASLEVSGLEDGSFIEDLTVKLLFKSKEDYDACVDKLSDAVKASWDGGTPMLKVAIGVLIGALVVGGLGLLPTDAGQSGALSNIEGDNNAVIIVGADTYQTSPEAFQNAIDKAIGKTSSVRAAQAALDATAPAREQSVGIEIEGSTKPIPVISEATAASLPKTIGVQDVSEDASYPNETVVVRASDYDSARKGWAGTIEGLVNDRTRIIFANDQDANKVAFRPEFKADVTVTYSSPVHDRAILIIVDKVH